MLRSGFYNIAGEVFRKGLSLAAIPLIIRQVGVAEYGLLTAASAAIGLFAVAEWGLSIASTVTFSRDIGSGDRTRVSEAWTILLVATAALGVFLSLLLFFGSDSVAQLLTDTSAQTRLFPRLLDEQRVVLSQALRLGSIWVGARLLQQVFIGIEQASGRYGLMNALTAVQSAASNIGIVIVAMRGGQTVAMIQWQVAVGIAGMFLHAAVGWMLLGELSPRWTWNPVRFREIVSYSSWTCLTTLGSAIFSQADKLVVFRILGDSAAGTYAAITLVASQINTFSALPIQPLLPEMSERLSRPEIDTQALIARVKQVFQVNALIALWLGVAMFALAPEIMRVMLPKQDTAAIVLSFRVATIIYALYSLNAAGYFLLLAANEVKATTYIVLGSAFLSILLIGIGAAQCQLLGAVSGNIGYFGIALLTVLAMKRMNVPFQTWMGWLQVPLAWFIVTVIVICFCNDQLSLRAGALLLGTIIIVGWLLTFEKSIAAALLNSAASRLEKQ